ncbi:unnamed protein product, partial [Prorocentrum cordatum]
APTARNRIGAKAGELETCVTLAAIAGDPGMKQFEGWGTLAADNITALNVPRAKCSKTLLEFVLSCCGKGGPPLIGFMLGCNIALGQSHWRGLPNVAFATGTDLFLLIGVSLALANLIGAIHGGGVARVLNKSDICKPTWLRAGRRPAGKEKPGREKTAYSRGEMRNAFLKGTGDIKGQPVEVDERAECSAEGAPAPAAQPTE